MKRLSSPTSSQQQHSRPVCLYLHLYISISVPSPSLLPIPPSPSSGGHGESSAGQQQAISVPPPAHEVAVELAALAQLRGDLLRLLGPRDLQMVHPEQVVAHDLVPTQTQHVQTGSVHVLWVGN